MEDQQELYNAMVIAHALRFRPADGLILYNEAGSATAVMEHRHDIKEIIPTANARMQEILNDLSDSERRASAEMAYIEKHAIKAYTIGNANYPERLKNCPDAPLVLYYCGTANLNAKRVINIVGTRHCTSYGQDLIQRFVADLSRRCPSVLIVSGLAYGVDIHAHRNALSNGLNTVGVLAHGLDDLYPSAHRDTANHMVQQGGLLTEYMTHTKPDKMNFVRRNRIVAGMCDATILVESAAKGGGLITCGMAKDYDRDVFAFPGRVGDVYSEGCNNLIRDCGATLINNAEDFVNSMGWTDDALLQQAREQGIERDMFPTFSAEEQKVVDALRKENDQQINLLAANSALPIQRLTTILFKLEMNGVVRQMAGGTTHLIL